MASNELIATMANYAGVTERQFYDTIMATVMPQKVTNEQFLAFLQVANQYNLNPLTKEIYAFPAKGGIQPVVSIDGWVKLANRNAQFDGLTHEDHRDEAGNLIAVTCNVYRKDRAHPVAATEYMDECKRSTDPWRQWPRRMLRHKATIQAIRYAFGFAGIIDPDEAERFHETHGEVVNERGTDALKAQLGAVEDVGGQGADEANDSTEGASGEDSSPAEPDAPADQGGLL